MEVEGRFESFISSPLGWLRAVAKQEALIELKFVEKPMQPSPSENQPCQLLLQLKQELSAYFSRSLQHFSIPIAPQGTVFQQLVWQQLQSIPYGTTFNYQQLALALKKPKAVRAAANANAHNPILILVPCHRVIGSNKQLTGYAGELWRKAKLIKLENSRTKILSLPNATKPLPF